uniref:Fibronectin type-III domain-containing protein n=1 Tax=Mola mola TaxID=94237 RepID=A0A3Q4ACQ7_MOLML
MNLFTTIWKTIIILLSFSSHRYPLLVSCNYCGYVTVKPAPLFLLGSNLTVYCHNTKCSQAKIFLVLNGVIVDSAERVSSTTTRFHVVNVRTPLSIVHCKLRDGSWSYIVGGLDLQGGRPPDKPENVICETQRSSHFINCTWERGQETHLPTAYNVSVSRENGTRILLDQVQNAETIIIPRAAMDEDIKYQLTVTAYNYFGASQSDPVILCVNDTVIPETPQIVQITFGNNSLAALLQWNTTRSSEPLRSHVRLRADNPSWETGNATDLSEGLIQVRRLRPLTEYEFQVRTCHTGMTHASTPSFTCRSATGHRSLCSRWSSSVRGRSNGKGPSQQLHVWRMLGNLGPNGLRKVKVLWKPPSREDYSGEVQQYKIFNEKIKERTCAAALSQCTVQVPEELQAISVSAVTSYGASPPADVPLRHSGESGPVLREPAPAENGSAVLVSWLWPGRAAHRSTPGGELLHYVLEWTSLPVAELQWQQVDKDQYSTSVTGTEEIHIQSPIISNSVLLHHIIKSRGNWKICPHDIIL